MSKYWISTVLTQFCTNRMLCFSLVCTPMSMGMEITPNEKQGKMVEPCNMKNRCLFFANTDTNIKEQDSRIIAKRPTQVHSNTCTTEINNNWPQQEGPFVQKPIGAIHIATVSIFCELMHLLLSTMAKIGPRGCLSQLRLYSQLMLDLAHPINKTPINECLTKNM